MKSTFGYWFLSEKILNSSLCIKTKILVRIAVSSIQQPCTSEETRTPLLCHQGAELEGRRRSGASKRYANQPTCQPPTSFPVPDSQAGDPVTINHVWRCFTYFSLCRISWCFKKRHFTENNAGWGEEGIS